jgi:hypothetical protein
VTDAVVPRSLTAAVHEALPRRSARQPGVRRRLVLMVLAVVVFIAALLVLGLYGLIPFGLARADRRADRRGDRRLRRHPARDER